MDDKHRDILRRHWSELRRDLEPTKLLPFLVSILDVTDEQEVKVKPTREDRIDKLLEILPRRGPKAFDEFVKALQEAGQSFLASPLIQEAEMEEMKTELNRARTHSARLREEVRVMRAGLEKEKQNHKKTLKELEELRSLHETLIVKSNDEKLTMATRLQELEGRIKQLEEEVSAERGEKEIFVEETTRLRQLCDQLDEAKTQTLKDLRTLQDILDKTSEENRELAKKLLGLNNNVLNGTIFGEGVRLISRHSEIIADRIPNGSPTHLSLIEDTDVEIQTKLIRNDAFSADLPDQTSKDLARVTKEREESKQRCKELEKQLEETLTTLERKRAGSFHDRATSPGKPVEFEDNLHCPHCEALEKECNLLKTERDFIKGKKVNLEEEIKQLNTRFREISEDHLREKQTLQKELQGMKEEQEKLSRQFESDLQKTINGVNEQKLKEVKVLQGQNDELKDQISKQKSEVHKITVQLMREKTQLEKNQEDLGKTKKNLSREKKKVKEVKEELEAESKAKKEALKQVEILVNELRKQDAHKCEEIARLREVTNVERSKCDALREEIERLRRMQGRVLNYRKDFDKHGVLYALGTNFGTTSWVNPGSNSASPIRINTSRSSDDRGFATDLLENRRGTLSGTRDEEKSWWCVDLTEKYALFLTHYSLRHGRDNGMSIIRNWRLEGSLDGRTWKTLKKHENDRGLKDPYPYYTATWPVDGEQGAFRYFRIFQTGKNSSGRFSIFLSGLELYGVLIDREA